MNEIEPGKMLMLAVRQRLPMLPADAKINLRYNPTMDNLMLMVGQQDRWVASTRQDENGIVHLDSERGIVRVEIPRASAIFRADWLRHHSRSSGARKRLGLP